MRPLPNGSQIGCYTIHGTLGAGAMGVVYRAHDPKANRYVAIKVPHRSADRLYREGEATAALSHPGIVRIHDQGEQGGVPFLVYELIPSARSLEELAPSLSMEQVLRYVRDAAVAIGHAHEHGIIHRDLKAENLLIDAEGRLRVADFGLARFAGAQTLTQTGVAIGTPYTMAPEQILGKRDQIGPPTDVWALGATLYQLITHTPPFEGGTLLELMRSITSLPHVPPSRLNPEVQAELESILERALQKSPEDRYPTATALAIDLERYLEGALAPRQRGIRLTHVLLGLGLTGGLLVFSALGWSKAEEGPLPSRTSLGLSRTDLSHYQEALVAASRGNRPRASRGRPSLAERRAAFGAVRAACSSGLAEAKDPGFAYSTLRELLGEDLHQDCERLCDEAFRQMLARRGVDRLLSLQAARLPFPPQEFVLEGAFAFLRHDLSSSRRLTPSSARMALQLGLPTREDGGILGRLSQRLPPQTGRDLPEGSATRAFIHLARSLPPRDVNALASLDPADLPRLLRAARAVEDAPLRDLGEHYSLEAAIFSVRLAQYMKKPRPNLAERLAELRVRGLRHWSPSLALSSTSLEREHMPPEAVEKALSCWIDLIERLKCSSEHSYAPPREVREQQLIQARACLLRELAVANRWEELECGIKAYPRLEGHDDPARDFYLTVLSCRAQLPGNPDIAQITLKAFQPPERQGLNYGPAEEVLRALLMATILRMSGDRPGARAHLKLAESIQSSDDPYLVALKRRLHEERSALDLR